jgi:hypothetical protein
MKKIVSIAMLFLMLFAFNNCSEDIAGTKDLNYVSLGDNPISIVVDKGSTTDKDISIYTTQITSSDRTFSIFVDDGTTADPATYDVPASVTVPANSNTGTFTVHIADVNLSSAGADLVIGIEASNGVFVGNNMTITILKYCAFDINDFIGDYMITEAGYGTYATTITLDANVANRIWITNFWDWTNDLAYYDFNPDNGSVTMPDQYITMGDGNSYLFNGSGTYNACNGTFHMEYGGDVAGTVHDFAPAN